MSDIDHIDFAAPIDFTSTENVRVKNAVDLVCAAETFGVDALSTMMSCFDEMKPSSNRGVLDD